MLALAQAPFAVPSLVVRTLNAYPQSADLTGKALAAMAPFAANSVVSPQLVDDAPTTHSFKQPAIAL